MVVSRVSARSRTSASRSREQLFDSPAGRCVITAGDRRRARPDPGHAALRLPAHRRRRSAGAGVLDGAAAPACRSRRSRPRPRPSRREPNAEATLGRPGAGRHARARGRLPADPAGRQGAGRRPARPHQGRAQEVRAGRRLPAAAGAHPRQPGAASPSVYRITLRGAVVGEGEAFPGMYMAINPGGATRPLPGTDDHATRPSACRRCGSRSGSARTAQGRAIRWLIARTVVATHLSQLDAGARRRSARAARRRSSCSITSTKLAPKLIEDVVPKLLPLATGAEGAADSARRRRAHPRHAHDRRGARRARAAHAGCRRADCRRCASALSRAILQQIFGSTRELEVATLDPQVEQMLIQASATRGAEGPGPRARAGRAVDATGRAVRRRRASSSGSRPSCWCRRCCATCWRASCAAPRRSSRCCRRPRSRTTAPSRSS